MSTKARKQRGREERPTHSIEFRSVGRIAATAFPVSDSSQRLANLDDLYKRGLITKDEHDAKRAEILKGL